MLTKSVTYLVKDGCRLLTYFKNKIRRASTSYIIQRGTIFLIFNVRFQLLLNLSAQFAEHFKGSLNCSSNERKIAARFESVFIFRELFDSTLSRGQNQTWFSVIPTMLKGPDLYVSSVGGRSNLNTVRA